MSDWQTIDELHLSFTIPRDDPRNARRVQRVLGGSRFLRRLRMSVREILIRYPSLRQVRVKISR